MADSKTEVQLCTSLDIERTGLRYLIVIIVNAINIHTIYFHDVSAISLVVLTCSELHPLK